MGFCGLKLQANDFSILTLLLQEEVSGEAPRVAPESGKKKITSDYNPAKSEQQG